MERNFIYTSETGDGYRNLATDEWFLDHVGKNDLILYFYQNENAVIIGKNQNPWVECDSEAMKRDGVQLVRRVSGGGAVYHDMGNLNFSFIAGEERYDLDRQMNLVVMALRELGISASLSGRNDLVCEGRKVSGNAFAHRKMRHLHHGTLLIDTDLERLSQYLTVDPKKIRSKGIDSVRSRVCNLKEFRSDLTVKEMTKALTRAFENCFGYWAEWQFSKTEREEIDALAAKHASDRWRLGQTPKFDLEWRERFSWGGFQLCLSFEQGKIIGVNAYSDAMETQLCEEAERLLTGVDYTEEAVKTALLSSAFSQLKEVANCKIL